LKPVGIADIAASTVSDAIPHRTLFSLRSSSFDLTRAKQHLPCTCGNLDNRSISVRRFLAGNETARQSRKVLLSLNQTMKPEFT
jgi:hypothetical protein